MILVGETGHRHLDHIRSVFLLLLHFGRYQAALQLDVQRALDLRMSPRSERVPKVEAIPRRRRGRCGRRGG